MSERKELVMPAVVLTAICLIVAVLLSATDLITRDRIAQQELLAAETARSEVLPAASSFEELPLSEEIIQTGVESLFAGSGGEGYVVSVISKGYGGDMSIMVGLDAEYRVTGIKILSSDETPGLGKKTENESFLSQYIGNSGSFTVVKGTASGESEISAVTGATISSRAVTEAVNNAIAAAQTGGAQGE